MNTRLKIYFFCLLAAFLLASDGWAMHGARTSYGYGRGSYPNGRYGGWSSYYANYAYPSYGYPSIRGWTYPSYPYVGTYYVDSTPIRSNRYRASYRPRTRTRVEITRSSGRKKTTRGVFLTE